MTPPAPLVRSDLSSELLLGLGGAAVLAILAGALLPKGQRVRARQGAVLLVLAILSIAAQQTGFLEDTPRALVFASTFFLLASIGRSLVVLLIEVRAARRTTRPAPRNFSVLSTTVDYLPVTQVALLPIIADPHSTSTTTK